MPSSLNYNDFRNSAKDTFIQKMSPHSLQNFIRTKNESVFCFENLFRLNLSRIASKVITYIRICRPKRTDFKTNIGEFDPRWLKHTPADPVSIYQWATNLLHDLLMNVSGGAL